MTEQQTQSSDSQAQAQTDSQDTSTESQRINGLMASLGKRTNERDRIAAERDQAVAERDEAQRQFDEMVRTYAAQPSQQDVLAADEAARAAPAPAGPVTNEKGEVLMTEAQWQEEERQGRIFAPVGASKPSQVPRNDKASDLARLDAAISQHLRGS